MPPAVIAAGVGAAASIGGGLLASNSTKKATQAAADMSAQTAANNNALYREFYGRNEGHLAPFIGRGNAAGNQLNAMLGLPANNNAPPAKNNALATPVQSQASGAPSPPAHWQPSYSGELHYTQEPAYRASLAGRSPEMAITQETWFDNSGNPIGPTPTGPMPSQIMGAAPPTSTPTNPADPFKQYITNSDYGFQFGTGSNALNHGLASSGSINSGSAMKAMEKYRQNLQAGYRGEYMGLLGQQQGVGFSAASALGGVGQGYAGMMGQNNQNAGDNQANALLMRGAANSNMWNGIAGGIGNALGSSYMLWR